MIIEEMWQERAACKNVSDPEIFFPTGGKGKNDRAKSFCRVCPVQAECLDFALQQSPGIKPYMWDFGIWGNTTPNMRTIIKKRRIKANNEKV